MDQEHTIIYFSGIREGFDLPTVKRNLVRTFSLSEAKAENIMQRGWAKLQMEPSEEKLRHYLELFQTCGLEASLEMPSESPPPSPQAPEETPGTGTGGGFPPAPERPAVPLSFEFHGSGGEYFRIWIVNLLLSIITLGIYSAWAKVRRKQYFYGNTRLKGSGFEYLANPVKILKGRLLVVGVFIAYSIVSGLVPFIQIFFLPVFFFLVPWVVIRSLAFNAYNSAFRNIRFGFKAGYWEAIKAYLLWPLLSPFTLGLTYPIAYRKQKYFMVKHHRYGNQPFSFSAGNKDYYKIFFFSFLLGLIVMAIVSLLVPLFVGLDLLKHADMGLQTLIAIFSLLIYLLLFLVISTYFKVRTTNLLYNSTALGKHRFRADLEVKGYLWLVFSNTLATALTLGFFHPWAAVRTQRYMAEHLYFIPKGSLDDFVAGEQQAVSALGDEAAEFMDLDIGL